MKTLKEQLKLILYNADMARVERDHKTAYQYLMYELSKIQENISNDIMYNGKV